MMNKLSACYNGQVHLFLKERLGPAFMLWYCHLHLLQKTPPGDDPLTRHPNVQTGRNRSCSDLTIM
ncbi:hypothetical protein BDV26DRAFT_255236 [Aspergillus bertholletiae]|uniref:Uncharacterized protein n=1 Tax=Aspergillus bertholletiae TaxID=1226010 RepID=A0A5N7BJK5_9EURO|nr:hypothetical protein BDV26DRAFT_255236 [Aspergillus bertholletiae]